MLKIKIFPEATFFRIFIDEVYRAFQSPADTLATVEPNSDTGDDGREGNQLTPSVDARLRRPKVTVVIVHPCNKWKPNEFDDQSAERIGNKKHEQIADQGSDASRKSCEHLFFGIKLGPAFTPALVDSDVIAPAVVPATQGIALGGTCFEMPMPISTHSSLYQGFTRLPMALSSFPPFPHLIQKGPVDYYCVIRCEEILAIDISGSLLRASSPY